MKLFLCVLMAAIFSLPAFALETHLDWNAAFAPPHNEPVVGNKVARYRLQLEPQVKLSCLRLTGQVNIWAVNTWTSRDSHESKSWKHDDWSIEDLRYTFKVRGDIGPEKLSLFTEYYQPINSADWGKGATSFGSYWWLVGVSGRIW